MSIFFVKLDQLILPVNASNDNQLEFFFDYSSEVAKCSYNKIDASIDRSLTLSEYGDKIIELLNLNKTNSLVIVPPKVTSAIAADSNKRSIILPFDFLLIIDRVHCFLNKQQFDTLVSSGKDPNLKKYAGIF